MSLFSFLQNHKILFYNKTYWKFSPPEIGAHKDNVEFLTVSDQNITLFNVDVLSKLSAPDQDNWNMFDAYFLFLEKIKSHITRLNHVGFGYFVEDMEGEIALYKRNLPQEFELVEEDSGDTSHNRWFFIKHKTDAFVPKVELVLYQTVKYKDYCPQFQIDIDTDLSFESLKKMTNEFFGEEFFFWEFDVPNYGVVMAMGKLGQIDGVKILLGVGTNLRKPIRFKSI